VSSSLLLVCPCFHGGLECHYRPECSRSLSWEGVCPFLISIPGATVLPRTLLGLFYALLSSVDPDPSTSVLCLFTIYNPQKCISCVCVCVCVCVYMYIYTGCPRRNVPDFGRVFLMSKDTDITQNTYIQS